MPKEEIYFAYMNTPRGRVLRTSLRMKVIVARSRIALRNYMAMSGCPPGTYSIGVGVPMEVTVNDLEFIVEEEA